MIRQLRTVLALSLLVGVPLGCALAIVYEILLGLGVAP